MAYLDTVSCELQNARVMKIFIENIRHTLQLKGITQKQLADSLGVSAPAISSIMRGKEGVTIDRAAKIANALGVPLADLFSEKLQKKRGRD